MTELSRRVFIRSTAVAGGVAFGLPGLGGWGSSTALGALRPNVSTTAGLITVRPGDPRYPALVAGANQRWTGTPDYVLLADTSDEVVQAVQETVDKGLRFAPRSGGHCYEDFTSRSDVRVDIDMSTMKSISYDPSFRAFAVQPGATVGEVYQTMFEGWGVTIPAGTCPSVAVGGHIVGGGYGPLSRLLGVTVDYLEAIEVVVVDKHGKARKVVATRHANDPNRDLWWAHTGAGGGNFGVITKYWLRSPNAHGVNPAEQLPRAPTELIISEVTWLWEGMTERAFTRLLRNFSLWHERHSSPDSVHVNLFSAIKPRHRSAGEFLMSSQINAAVPHADRLLDDYLAAVNAGTGLTYRVDARKRVDWLFNVLHWPGLGGPGFEGKGRFKAKSAYQRRAFPDTQLKTMYKHLSGDGDDYDNPAALVEIAGYGGVANSVASSATALPQRDSVLKLLYLNLWAAASEDAKHLSWLRAWYKDMYASTGGVPRSNRINDGAFINYADADLADPVLNDSGTPWHELYFKDGYNRLQRVKANWDPKGLFSHALAIRKP